MLPIILKIAHILSLAVWSGAMFFFSFFVALPTIASMQRFAQKEGNWLNLSTEAQGTRLAGEFLDLVFTRYFPFQCVCGLIALVTSLWWWNTPGWLAKARVLVIAMALGGAAVNYFVLAPRVHDLRVDRYSSDGAVAEKANAAFGPAHTVSLLVDMATLLCVLIGIILVLWLPKETPLAE